MAVELAPDLRLSEGAPSMARPIREWLAGAWSGLWPKLGAILLTLVVWQAVVWSGWRPPAALPGPWPVLQRLAGDLGHARSEERRVGKGVMTAAVAGTLRKKPERA